MLLSIVLHAEMRLKRNNHEEKKTTATVLNLISSKQETKQTRFGLETRIYIKNNFTNIQTFDKRKGGHEPLRKVFDRKENKIYS